MDFYFSFLLDVEKVKVRKVNKKENTLKHLKKETCYYCFDFYVFLFNVAVS